MRAEVWQRVLRTLRLLTTGRCEAFDDAGNPAQVRMPWRKRLPLALWWWDLPTWFPD
jgi:hypothetical protein